MIHPTEFSDDYRKRLRIRRERSLRFVKVLTLRN
jgi:hypothetical protein